MICCPGNEYTPWHSRLEHYLGPKSRLLPLKEMLYFLRSTVIRPAQFQIETFFSMYDCYSTISELPRVKIVPEVYSMPAANLKILYKKGLNLPVIIFEYNIEYQTSPEDRDFLLIQCSGFIPVNLQNVLIRTNSSFRMEHEEMYGCITPYPTLFNCEEVSMEDIAMDFTHRFMNATELFVDRWDGLNLPLL